MHRLFTICAMAISLFVLNACNKKSEVMVAGKGGGASFHIYPKHGVNEEVDSCWVYIKYNTLNMPYDGKFDDSMPAVLVDGKKLATFTGLTRGDYYFYATGYNPDHHDKISGGYPIFISDDAKTYDIILTMGH